jgi:LmbE family N-acetylglucosaminyl deacetylase
MAPGNRQEVRRLGVVMTVQRHDRPHPDIERTFTAVRAALPAANVAAFDAQLEAITHLPVVDLAALDEFLSGWWRIATRAAADPADWQRMRQEADQLQSGERSAGPTLAEVLGRRGVHL